MNKRKRIADYHDKIVSLATTHTLPELCRELGLATTSVSLYMDRHNIQRFHKKVNLEDYTDEIKRLIAEGKHTRELSIELGLNPTSVKYHLDKLGIKVRNGKFLEEDLDLENKVITLHNEGKTYLDISAILGINDARVPKILDKYEVEKRTPRGSYRAKRPINSNAFADFNTEEAVYWYGWLLTDGCIQDNGNVSIGLKGSDSETIYKLAEYLGESVKVRESTYFHKQSNKYVSCASLALMDSSIASRLREQGLTPRKSCKEKLPKFDWLDGEYASVFWRAALEGDGYISNYMNRHPELSLIGSEELLNGFKTYVVKHCGVVNDRELKTRDYGDPNFRLINYTGLDALKIMKVLWSKGSIFLERKRERVLGNLEKYNYRFIRGY